jgi:hypothetical protein
MGIPDWWKIQYFGDVVIDGYGNPMGDGWSNIQKFQNGMNPFKWYPPEGPQVQVNFRDGVDSHHANAILNWRCDSGLIPDNITIERAHQTRRGMTNYITFPLIHHRADGQIVTNWPLHSLSSIYNNSLSPTAQRLNNFVIFGSYQPIAQMPGQPNLRDYRYVDANINCYPPPVYQIQAHYPKPTQFAELSDTTARAISHTVLSVTAKRQTNGYVLTVLHPITHARYLLLVRDKNDPQWRASGYFLSGMNQNPMILHVDKNGMMTDPQIPIALPPVKYLADVVQPEFTAGWGEDSDRDGLPDIYEVLVTHTEPDNADTGDLGIPDGFRVVSNDGWNNWDKFRFRVNPFTHCEPAAPIVLKKPTISELRRAYSSNTDLPYTLQIEFQTNTATGFQPYSLWVDSNYVNPDSSGHARCDVRVSWKVPPANP